LEAEPEVSREFSGERLRLGLGEGDSLDEAEGSPCLSPRDFDGRGD
jgi:hypothetical protein